MKNIMKKLTAFLCAVVLSVCVLPYAEVHAQEDNMQFEEWMMQMFREALESDYLTYHYTLRHPENYQVQKPEELSFGHADMESYSEAMVDSMNTLRELESFDYDSLSLKQQRDYDDIYKYLNDSIALNQYPLLDDLFNPNSSILDNIVTNMTEFIFYTEEDFEDYLTVLSSIPELLDECLEMTRSQAELGIFLRDSQLDEALEWIEDFTDKKENSALIIIFENKLNEMEGISSEKKEEFRRRNHDLVVGSVIPAYENCYNVLESLRGSRTYGPAVCDLPGGWDYYQALARAKTSTNYTVEQMADLCEDYLEEAIEIMYTMIMEDIEADEEPEERSAEEVLQILSGKMQNYPKGPDVRFECSYLDPSVATENVLAYYMEPTLDDVYDNVVRVNGEQVSDPVELYQTLAHEGFPGHLYQFTWFFNQKPNPYRTQIGSIGYTEGWAMYASINAWFESGLDSNSCLDYALDEALGYVLNAYADLGVNGLGWSVGDLRKKIEALGLNGAIAQDYYDAVCDAAGVILPYGVGLAFFGKLRGMAAGAFGKNFDVKEFNEVLLRYGDRPFEVVEEDVIAYIESNGKEVPKEKDIEMLSEFYPALHGESGTSGANRPDFDSLFGPAPSGGSSNSGNGSHAANAPQQQEPLVSRPILFAVAAMLIGVIVAAVFGIRRHEKDNPFGE